ncbi:MAG: hypothetical protein RIS59_247, partial [Pseudomonadota bacterium]
MIVLHHTPRALYKRALALLLIPFATITMT